MQTLVIISPGCLASISSPFHVPSCCHCLFDFTVLWFYFCCQVHVFVRWRARLLIWTSLTSCLHTAHLCSILLYNLLFLGNAKLLHSFMPFKSLSFWWTLVYPKSPEQITQSVCMLPCLHCEQRFLSVGLQTPSLHLCWHLLCHVVMYVSCVVYFAEQESPFLKKKSLYS